MATRIMQNKYKNQKRFFSKKCFWGGMCLGMMLASSEQTVAAGTADGLADSLSTHNVALDSVNKHAIDFNPMDYVLQKRFLKKGKPFRKKPISENLFAGLFTGIDRIIPHGGPVLDYSNPLGVMVGYRFSPLHSLRLSGYYNKWHMTDLGYNLHQGTIDLDYMLNLTAYLRGYNPQRRVHVSGVAGVGYIHNKYFVKHHSVLKGQLGLNLDVAIGSNLHLYAEPYVAVTTGQLDLYEHVTELDFDALVGLRAGLKFTFNHDKYFSSDSIFNGNLFFELSQGMNASIDGDLPVLRTMGTNYQISVGKWFAPVFGVRATASVADYYWTRGKETATEMRPAYTTYYKGGVVEGRLEALFSLMNFSKAIRNKTYHPFDMNLAVGGLYGKKVNTTVHSKTGLNTNYWGGTAALQFLYNADNGTSLFLEPRYVRQAYNNDGNNAAYDVNPVDDYMQVSFGVRMNRPVRRERMKYRNDIFRPHFFAGGSVGGNKHLSVRNHIGDYTPNFQLAVHGGYHFHPLAGLRLRMEMLNAAENYHTAYVADVMGDAKRFEVMRKKERGLLNFQLDYMLNLTNAYQGYREDRRLNAYLTLGPGYTVGLYQGGAVYSKEHDYGLYPRFNESSIVGKGAWSFSAGALLEYRINSKVTLFADPQIQYYWKNHLFDGGSTSGLNDMMFKFSLGCSRSF